MDNMQHTGVIAVAVSGGADSLFSLMTLREQGANLIALHGVFFPADSDAENENREIVREHLAQICRKLGIPFFVADLSHEFRQRVIRPFVQAYADGLTPNPCALCNARIKFGLLQDAALARGADALATGHYARVLHQGEQRDPVLLQGKDNLKDQSYFLALTAPERLAKAVFPMGERHKKDILERLARQGVTIPQPGESQEVCFVPNDAYRDFLPRMAKELGISLPGPGPMLLRDGKRLGTHKGLWQYTEGQRKGLGIGWTEPLHVVGKEREANILRLGPRHEMRAEGCACANVNLLLAPALWPEQVLVKTRYREKPKAARVEAKQGDGGLMLRIRFLQPDTAVAPGQVAAVYIPEVHEKEPSLRLVAGGLITGAL